MCFGLPYGDRRRARSRGLILVAAGFLEYEREQARKRLATSTGGDQPQPRTNVAEAGEPGRARDKAGARMGVSGSSPIFAVLRFQGERLHLDRP